MSEYIQKNGYENLVQTQGNRYLESILETCKKRGITVRRCSPGNEKNTFAYLELFVKDFEEDGVYNILSELKNARGIKFTFSKNSIAKEIEFGIYIEAKKNRALELIERAFSKTNIKKEELPENLIRLMDICSAVMENKQSFLSVKRYQTKPNLLMLRGVDFSKEQMDELGLFSKQNPVSQTITYFTKRINHWKTGNRFLSELYSTIKANNEKGKDKKEQFIEGLKVKKDEEGKGEFNNGQIDTYSRNKQQTDFEK